MFSRKNAVLVALAQVATIVAGILAGGLTEKFWHRTGLPLPTGILLLRNFGVMLLAAPLAWIAMTIAIRNSNHVSDDAKRLAFLAGIALILLLIAVEGYAVISPWLGGEMLATAAAVDE